MLFPSFSVSDISIYVSSCARPLLLASLIFHRISNIKYSSLLSPLTSASLAIFSYSSSFLFVNMFLTASTYSLSNSSKCLCLLAIPYPQISLLLFVSQVSASVLFLTILSLLCFFLLPLILCPAQLGCFLFHLS